MDRWAEDVQGVLERTGPVEEDEGWGRRGLAGDGGSTWGLGKAGD